MAGLYGIVNTVHCITSLHNVQSGSITVACDNKQAIRIFNEDFIPDPKHSDFDLVLATWNLIQQSPIEWEGVHVKGHQDDNDLHQPFTRNEKLNIEMDTMAKAYWQHVFHHDDFYMPLPPQHHIHGEGWQLWRDGTKLNNPKTDILYNTIVGPITRSWWARHGHVCPAASHLIDWEVSGLTMTALPQWLQQWVTKTASENCGVGTTLVEWGYQEDARCPRCNHILETTSHVTQCQAQGADVMWRESMDRVEQYLENSNTDPRIQTALLQALTCWQQMQPQDWQAHDDDIVQALQAQTTIGWQDWLEGLPALQWRRLQQYYYNLTDDNRTGKAWLKGLIKLLIQSGQKQWQHRNDYKHVKGQPRYKEMIRKLNDEIAVEYSRGTATLLPGDKVQLDVNLLSLLRKSVPYKQAWLSNVSQAGERCIRIQQQDNDLQTKSYENSLIVKWQRTGVCR